MKYILAPVTIVGFGLLTYWSIYSLVLLIALLFSLHWFWLIVLYVFVGSAFFSTIRLWILIALKSTMHFYDYNPYLKISHAMGAIVGIMSIVFFFYQNPPLLGSLDRGNQFILYSMWNIAWFKTLFVTIPVAITIIFVITAPIFEVLNAKPLSEDY